MGLTTTAGGLNLTTNHGDPRSANQTLGNGFEPARACGFDSALFDWKPHQLVGIRSARAASHGKVRERLFFDNESIRKGRAQVHARRVLRSVLGTWLSERGTASDATMIGGQVGMTGNVGGHEADWSRGVL